MKPEQAINYPIGHGPYAGRTIGWIAKFGRLDGLNWLFRQYSTARLQPETMEAIRSFFAAPKFASWLAKVMPSYPGCEPFFYPDGHQGCPACGDKPLSTTFPANCKHGCVRGYREVSKCPCGWGRELYHRQLMFCEDCDRYPLFDGVRKHG